MTLLVFCGEKTCVFNKKGKCANFKVALNEQGVCMGYSPIIMPNVNIGGGISGSEGSKNPMGFGG